MARYCLSVCNYDDQSFPLPPFGPSAAFNRVHFTNRKLSTAYESPLNKYVKYTFNYFKSAWQVIVHWVRHTCHCTFYNHKKNKKLTTCLGTIHIQRLTCGGKQINSRWPNHWCAGTNVDMTIHLVDTCMEHIPYYIWKELQFLY